ncbi:hypothetical protein COU54_04585 [Candidatus Pacearchaeota archaeon CG10_big_fil_rev_8_21_14_0_10_31_24]|nr:MAG: hypothetical protein COU54_04585 [Candidatus Pacearchaeota archaeon CG10_big_fil_rev_8_21_14_0_10_31_24]
MIFVKKGEVKYLMAIVLTVFFLIVLLSGTWAIYTGNIFPFFKNINNFNQTVNVEGDLIRIRYDLSEDKINYYDGVEWKDFNENGLKFKDISLEKDKLKEDFEKYYYDSISRKYDGDIFDYQFDPKQNGDVFVHLYPLFTGEGSERVMWEAIKHDNTWVEIRANGVDSGFWLQAGKLYRVDSNVRVGHLDNGVIKLEEGVEERLMKLREVSNVKLEEIELVKKMNNLVLDDLLLSKRFILSADNKLLDQDGNDLNEVSVLKAIEWRDSIFYKSMNVRYLDSEGNLVDDKYACVKKFNDDELVILDLNNFVDKGAKC